MPPLPLYSSRRRRRQQHQRWRRRRALRQSQTSLLHRHFQQMLLLLLLHLGQHLEWRQHFLYSQRQQLHTRGGSKKCSQWKCCSMLQKRQGGAQRRRRVRRPSESYLWSSNRRREKKRCKVLEMIRGQGRLREERPRRGQNPSKNTKTIALQETPGLLRTSLRSPSFFFCVCEPPWPLAEFQARAFN